MDTLFMADAACVGLDPTLFDPTTSKSKTGKQWREICSACPVRQECLNYALEIGDDYMYYGNTTPAERRLIRSLVPREVRLSDRSVEIQIEQTVEISVSVDGVPLHQSSDGDNLYQTQLNLDYWEHVRPRKVLTVQELHQVLDDLLESL